MLPEKTNSMVGEGKAKENNIYETKNMEWKSGKQGSAGLWIELIFNQCTQNR